MNTIVRRGILPCNKQLVSPEGGGGREEACEDVSWGGGSPSGVAGLLLCMNSSAAA